MASAHPDNHYLVITKILFLLLLLPLETNSLSFEFPSFDKNSPGVDLQGNASISNSQIQLTKNVTVGSYGRALYPKAIQLWDATANQKRVADFTTNFIFSISHASTNSYGDGLTLLLVPENTSIPNDSSGGCLALFSNNPPHTGCLLNQTVVAIEFDTFPNPGEPTLDHIGIDINSTVSAAYADVTVGLRNTTSQAFISYNSKTNNLSVSLSVNHSSVHFNLSYIVDLSTVLPKRVQVGFSASTGTSTELHQILSWGFNSTLEDIIVAPSPNPTRQQGGTQGRQSKRKGGMMVGIGVGVFLILIFGISIAWMRLRRKSHREGSIEDDEFNIDNNFDQEVGPKRFSYSELRRATNNFSIKGKLGEGGFGAVYKGVLKGPQPREVAVKKIKSRSTQGKREYVSEVKIISRLRHRNLVQLLGWCHDHGELLLVYEFLPNRSLDFHLFGRELILLPWPTRYKIALGLASAVLYLHEEWEQSVFHRDIKSSNVMLDLNFNPKLGDFGLARLADHDVGLQTTAPAGTRGYLAPECLLTRKVSKELDVYSFGIVALEIACGKPVIEIKEQAREVNLAEWVWGLYGEGCILEAVDSQLEGEFDEKQAECLMVVGLWCSHPYIRYRPSIKEAIAALNFEAPLPSLPPQFPVPRYDSIDTNRSLSLSPISSMENRPYISSSSNSHPL